MILSDFSDKSWLWPDRLCIVQLVPNANTSPADYEIRWIPEAIANLLHSHDIRTRTELAETLGVARSTVYRSFGDDWSGSPSSMAMLSCMAGYFRVPLSRIVTEPGRPNVRKLPRRTERVTVRKAG